MKAFIYGAACLAASALAVAANAQTSPQQGQGQMVEMPAANWLFVQTADSLSSDGKTITLKGVAPQTLMFSDRPERMTGDASTAKFVAFWTGGKSDFEKDPPNATLSTIVDGKPQTSVVELTNPQLNGDSLTYTIKVLDGQVPTAGQTPSLFIDWWYWAPRRWGGGCWRGPWGGLHCRPGWAW